MGFPQESGVPRGDESTSLGSHSSSTLELCAAFRRRERYPSARAAAPDRDGYPWNPDSGSLSDPAPTRKRFSERSG